MPEQNFGMCPKHAPRGAQLIFIFYVFDIIRAIQPNHSIFSRIRSYSRTNACNIVILKNDLPSTLKNSTFRTFIAWITIDYDRMQLNLVWFFLIAIYGTCSCGRQSLPRISVRIEVQTVSFDCLEKLLKTKMSYQKCSLYYQKFHWIM